MSGPMSAAELIERYSDPAFRDALTPLMDLRLLLTECKVPPTYQVRRDMYEALSLTPAGDSFRQLLTKKNVKYPDARFMCYLRMLSTDLLIDPLQTDRDSLIKAVGQQVVNREIQFPYVYGRDLYGKLYGMPLPEHRTVLTHEETTSCRTRTGRCGCSTDSRPATVGAGIRTREGRRPQCCGGHLLLACGWPGCGDVIVDPEPDVDCQPIHL
jgi:hypothetical protein